MGFVQVSNLVTSYVMSPAEAAYIAGLVDGEGTIGLYVKHRKGRKPHQFNAALRIANTNLRLLEAVTRLAQNGQIFADRRGTGQKACYDWTLSANQIRHVLPQILPYLIAKRRQAECVIRFLSLVRYPQGVAEEDVPEVLSLKEEVSRLNKRGLSGEEEAQASIKEPQCREEGCRQQCYRGHPVCYRHWQEIRELSVGHCKECKKEMLIGDARKEYCSQKCQAAHWHKHVKVPMIEAEKAEREKTTCPHCTRPVDRSSYKGRIYCNNQCRDAYHNGRRLAREAGAERESV